MKSKFYSTLKFIIGWPLSLLALIFILKLIAPKTQIILTRLTHIHLELLLYSAICFLLFYLTRGYIWYRLIKKHKASITYNQSLFLWAISEIKRYIPGNIWSFLGRTIMFEKVGIKKKEIGSLMIIEAQLFVIGTTITSLLAIPFLTKYFLHIDSFLITIILTIFVGILIIIYIFNQKFIKLRYFFPQLLPAENLFIIFLSTLSALLFGLGYYLSALSFTFIPSQLIIELTGYFIFCFIIGYLSFLTPAGFGVREGILIVGLSKIMPVNTASFISLFARVILITAELIFLICSFFIFKILQNTKE